MPVDFSGNTLGNARSISLNTNNSLSDWVGSSDSYDFYQFSINSRGSVGITLSGMSNDADLRLIRDYNNNRTIDNTDIIASSSLGGNQVDRISQFLEAGTYFIGVNQFSGDTHYTLQTQFQPFDGAGDSLVGSRGINVGPNTLVFNDYIGATDPNDYYRFTLNNTSDFCLSMTGMTGDGDVQLLNANGAMLSSSTAGSNLNESINRQLTAGTYYVRVYPYGGANTNYTLSLSATNAVVRDWFSSSLRDSELVTAARALAADGNLNRNDMLSLFRNVQDGGLVDEREIGDLRTLVAHSSRFLMTDSLRWLSNQLTRDASTNMSASNFEENLVGRWFLGTMAPTAVFNEHTLTYSSASGTLFGPSGQARIGDIDQAGLGDCTFLAALGATFGNQSGDSGDRSSAVINNMITDNGDNTFTMRFYSPTGNGQMEAQYVTVDRRLATVNGQILGAQTNNGILWAALTERAYAQWQEWLQGSPGYNLIGNGDIIDRPLQFVTGRTSAFYSTQQYTYGQISSALSRGEALTAGCFEYRESSLIVAHHAYSITNAYTTSWGEQRIVVRNPWGVDGRGIQGNDDGFIELSFSEFQQSFGGISIA